MIKLNVSNIINDGAAKAWSWAVWPAARGGEAALGWSRMSLKRE